MEQALSKGHEIIKIEATLNAEPFYGKYGFKKISNSSFVQPSGIEIETVLMEMRRPC